MTVVDKNTKIDSPCGCGCADCDGSNNHIYIDNNKICYVIDGDSCCLDISGFTKSISNSCKKNITIPAKGSKTLDFDGDMTFLAALLSDNTEHASWRSILGNYLDYLTLNYSPVINFETSSFANDRVNIEGTIKLIPNNQVIIATWNNLSTIFGGDLGVTWTEFQKSWNSYNPNALTNVTQTEEVTIEFVGGLDQDDLGVYTGIVSGMLVSNGMTYIFSMEVSGTSPTNLVVDSMNMELQGKLVGDLNFTTNSVVLDYNTTTMVLNATISGGIAYSTEVKDFNQMQGLLVLSSSVGQPLDILEFYNPLEKEITISLIAAG